MSAYRFCRTDDIALLVEAYNRCCAVHVPGEPPLTVADFKRGARDLGLWCGSSMVALEGGEPIAVLLSAKRPDATLVHRIGVHPEHLRRGHGRHLLTSLGSKLAILGPPRLLAELPAGRTAVTELLEACGFRRERTYADYELAAPPASRPPAGAVAAVGVDEIPEASILAGASVRGWERAFAVLGPRDGRVRGLAIGDGDADLAFVLHRDAARGDAVEIVAIGAPGDERGDALARLLLAELAAGQDRPVRFLRVAPEEVPLDRLSAWGFRRSREHAGYACEAKAA